MSSRQERGGRLVLLTGDRKGTSSRVSDSTGCPRDANATAVAPLGSDLNNAAT